MIRCSSHGANEIVETAINELPDRMCRLLHCAVHIITDTWHGRR